MLEKLLLFLLIFFLPSNLAYHFDNSSFLVDGITVDYLIPKLFLTDIFILALVIPWLFRASRKNLKSLRKALHFVIPAQAKSDLAQAGIHTDRFRIRLFHAFTGMTMIPLIFFVWTLFQSIFLAPNHLAALYMWLKLLEMSLLAWYLSHKILKNPKVLKLIKVALSLAVLFQSLLAWSQWLLQRNLFPYWILGESQYSASTAAIDKISWLGALKVPPLGTTPHPNVLGGFLAVSLVILLLSPKFLKNLSFPKNLKNLRTLSQWITLLFGFSALLLTHSLSAILAFTLGLLLLSPKILKNLEYLKWSLVPLLLATSYLLLAPGIESTSLSRRLKLNQIAIQMITANPLGVGLNNFTVVMPQYGEIEATYRFLQPVHNIYFLFWSESGLIGIVIVLALVSNLRSLSILSVVTPLLMILTIGAVDHYPLTLQTGQLLLAICVAFLGVNPQRKQLKTVPNH